MSAPFIGFGTWFDPKSKIPSSYLAEVSMTGLKWDIAPLILRIIIRDHMLSQPFFNPVCLEISSLLSPKIIILLH